MERVSAETQRDDGRSGNSQAEINLRCSLSEKLTDPNPQTFIPGSQTFP